MLQLTLVCAAGTERSAATFACLPWQDTSSTAAMLECVQLIWQADVSPQGLQVL